MVAIKGARKFIQANPQTPAAKTLSALIISLESDGSFALHQLYTLSCAHFELALKIVGKWRLDRYFSSKGHLLGLSVQASQMAKS